MRITVFGAHGQTGLLVVRHALAAGHDTIAVTRRPTEFPLSGERLSVAGGDVLDASTLPPAVDGADAVVSTLGVPMRMGRIDTYATGTRNIVDAMRAATCRRLVVVSSTAVARYPGRTGAPLALRFVEPVLKSTIGRTTYADQRRMESTVAESGLAWTVVRPSGLFDLDHVTEYVAGQVDPIGAFTSRTDLAHYLVTLAENEGPRDAVTVSTVTDTPTLWEMVRREALAG